MKNTNYDNKLSMVLDIAKRSGIILASLGKELGVAGQTVGRWRNGRNLPESPEEVISTLQYRAKFLSKINLDIYDIKRLRKDFGITVSALAEELGISHQGLLQQIEEDWPIKQRKDQVQEIIRGIGRNILEGSR